MSSDERGQQPAPVRRVAVPSRTRSVSGQPYDRDPRQTANQIGKAILLGVVLLSIGVGLFFRFKTARFTNLVSTEAIEAAQIARNFRMHRTLFTRITFPYALAGSHPDSKGYDIGRAPLYPVALGLFFQTRGISDDAVVMFNALCMFALAWVLYRIMALAFDRGVALWSVLAYFGGVHIIGMALTADGILLTALLFSLAVLAALHCLKATTSSPSTGEPQGASGPADATRMPWLWLGAVGVMGGLAYLAGRFSPLLWLPLAAVATAGLGARRKPAFLMVVGISLLLGVVWWGRNLVATGHPWSRLQMAQLVMNTADYPGISVLGTFSDAPGSPVAYLLAHPGDTVRKVARGLVELYRAVPDITNIYLFAFLVGAIIWLPKTPERRLLYSILLWTLGIQILTTAFTTASDAPFSIVRPLATGISVAAVVHWLRGLKVSRGLRLLAASGVVLVVAVPYLASAVLGRPVRPGAPVVRVQEISKYLDLEEKTVFLTDNPWVVAWYGPHRAILLPKQPQDMDSITRLSRAPHLVYLTRDLLSGGRGADDPWRKALTEPEETRKLGPALFFPDNELLTMTPKGAKELKPDTRKRFENLLARQAEARRRGPRPAATPSTGE